MKRGRYRADGGTRQVINLSPMLDFCGEPSASAIRLCSYRRSGPCALAVGAAVLMRVRGRRWRDALRVLV